MTAIQARGPSSIPSTHVKNLGVPFTCNSSTGDVEAGGSLTAPWPASLANSTKAQVQ